MRPRDSNKLKELELKYRGIALEDGLWSAAEALARQIGEADRPDRPRWDSTQYPFQRALAQHVKKMEARYGGLLEAAPDAMVVTDGEGEIVLINAQAEKQFGYERFELLGQKVTVIVDGGFAQHLVAEGAEVATGYVGDGIATGIELTGTRKDGSHFPVEIMLGVVESTDGMLVTAAIRNVSARKAAERQLARMEARSRALLEAAPDPIIVVNKRGRIVLVNNRAEQVFGYGRDAILGEAATSLIPHGLADRLLTHGTQPLEASLAEQAGAPVELIGRRKDGAEFPIEMTLAPAHSAEGMLAVAVVRDISTRKSMHTQLADQEDRYRRFLESTPDAMVVVDQVGDVVFFNAQAEHRFGRTRDEVIGRSITALIPEGFAERLAVDPLHSLEAALAQQIGAGVELSGCRKDGSRFPVEVMFSPLESTTRGTLVIATIRDISVRKAAERHQLEAQQGKFDALFATLPEALIVSGSDGCIRAVNPAAEALFGYAEGELDARPLADLAPERFRSVGLHAVPAPDDPNNRRGVRSEAIGLRHDGTEFPLDVTAKSADTVEGRLVFSIVQDARVRRAAAQALREHDALERRQRDLSRANQDLQQFAYVAARNLEGPLQELSAVAARMTEIDRGKLDADGQDRIDQASRQGRDMLALVTGLLAFAQAGTANLDLRPVAARSILDKAQGKLAAAIIETKASITCTDLPEIVVDADQLTTLFQSVIANALAYKGKEPPRVHISAEMNKTGEWIFAFADNGIGIDRPYYERIFQMFQRLHRAEDRPGTGIGLALCQKIAERHGGRMWVQSQPGLGSTFYLALPNRELSPPSQS